LLEGYKAHPEFGMKCMDFTDQRDIGHDQSRSMLEEITKVIGQKLLNHGAWQPKKKLVVK
jgi:hypothetical protein